MEEQQRRKLLAAARHRQHCNWGQGSTTKPWLQNPLIFVCPCSVVELKKYHAEPSEAGPERPKPPAPGTGRGVAKKHNLQQQIQGEGRSRRPKPSAPEMRRGGAKRPSPQQQRLSAAGSRRTKPPAPEAGRGRASRSRADCMFVCSAFV